jgi:hypothetical protein
MRRRLSALSLIVASALIGAYSGRVWAQACSTNTCSTQWDGITAGKYRMSKCLTAIPCTPTGVPTFCRHEACGSCGSCGSSQASQCPIDPDACGFQSPVLCSNLCGC